MKSKTYSNIEKVPVTNKVLRGSSTAKTVTTADRSAYKKYATESQKNLVKSVTRKTDEVRKERFD